MRYAELEKDLKKIGCYIFRQGANHSIWYSPITNETCPISRHKTQEVPIGTLKAIKRAMGLK